MDIILACMLIFWNLVIFVMFGADKHRAKRQLWRTKESTLIACAYAMGAVGATLGMYIFRHKTRKKRFRMLIYLALVVNVAVFVLLERI